MESKSLNIGVGKIGSSTLFDEKRWSSHGGCLESPALIKTLARYNPEHKFYIIGKSDFSRLSPSQKKEINHHGNIIDIWDGTDKDTDHIEHPENWFKAKGIKLDTAVLYPGPCGGANIPNRIQNIKNPSEIAKTLYCFATYAGPIIHYLNVTGIKYFVVVPDPRYHPIRARDCFNVAKFGLSQYNSKDMDVKHIRSYEDQSFIRTKVPINYAGIETVVLMTKKKHDIRKLEKSIPMSIILNEGGNGGLERGPMLKEYVLDHHKDIEVYGKWSDEWLKDPRFKGPVHINLLEDMLKKTKATFIIPIEKGWVTAKFWEMAHYGILPFMHPYYDGQGHLNCHEILRVKSPRDFREKYDAVMNDDKLYAEVLGSLNDMLEEKYYTGQHINNVVMKAAYYLSGQDPKEYELTADRINTIDGCITTFKTVDEAVAAEPISQETGILDFF